MVGWETPSGVEQVNRDCLLSFLIKNPQELSSLGEPISQQNTQILKVSSTTGELSAADSG